MYMYMKISEMLDIHEDSTSGSFCCAVWPRWFDLVFLNIVFRIMNVYLVFFLKNFSVWLGGLFIPEAYITATRQYVAQANSWSLEELYLDVSNTTYMYYIYMYLDKDDLMKAWWSPNF